VNTIIQTAAYRLGVLDVSPKINITSTVNTILPPLNNNLFMSINDEMGFNNLDVSMPEDYSVTGNETTSQVKLMFAKIMFSILLRGVIKCELMMSFSKVKHFSDKKLVKSNLNNLLLL
jgi:hypothetical protein